MYIDFHGAARTVTGSQHLVSVNGHRLLLDCGLFQGNRKLAFEINRTFDHDIRKLDSVILSHAHIDHAGNLPSLARNGYRGPVHATAATHDMSEYMLRDSAHIQEYDVEYVNKKRARQGKQPFEPLYTTAHAEAILERFVDKPYARPFEVTPGVVATFRDAGHILGSAITTLELDDRGVRRKLVFSGDLGRKNTPILRDPAPLDDTDILIMESTYGDRQHGPREQIDDKLASVVDRVVASGGKLIIPAFAVGRTQELIYALHRLMDDGRIPRIPVYVDSPLATRISRVYRRHQAIFDEQTLDFIGLDEHNAALHYPELHFTESVDESKALNDTPGPLVIISASGMVEHGRVLHHLRNGIEDPRNHILIVSWQAPHTLGRRLVEGQDEVKIFGDRFVRRAGVSVIDGFSAHADRDALLNWVRPVLPRIEHIFLVHGDIEPMTALREGLLAMGARNVHMPEPHARFEV